MLVHFVSIMNFESSWCCKSYCNYSLTHIDFTLHYIYMCVVYVKLSVR